MVAVPITGTDGSIEVDSTPIENMQEWSYKPEANIIEGMGGFGSAWDQNAVGLLEGSGSCKGVFATGATGQAALETAFYARQLVVLNLAATSGGTPLSINARIAQAADHDAQRRQERVELRLHPVRRAHLVHQPLIGRVHGGTRGSIPRNSSSWSSTGRASSRG
jgi:hypothetical protein